MINTCDIVTIYKTWYYYISKVIEINNTIIISINFFRLSSFDDN